MGYKIDEIEGIGPASAEKLGAAGIKSKDDLLKLCCDSTGRKATAEKTGVGGEYSELLEAADADTVKELRNRRCRQATP